MTRENEILQFLHYHPDSSRSEIEVGMNLTESPATVKRILAALVEAGSAIVSGQGRSTRYSVSPQAHVTMELNIDTYFQKETDEREIQTSFNFELINYILPKVELFTAEEKDRLDALQAQFTRNLAGITLMNTARRWSDSASTSVGSHLRLKATPIPSWRPRNS